MKIMFLNTLYPPHVAGGAEITVRTLAEGLRARGHDVLVLTTGPDRGLTEEVLGGVRVFRAGMENVYWHYGPDRPAPWRRVLWHARDAYNPKMGKLVDRMVRRERPDIVQCHNLAGWSVAAWEAIRGNDVRMVQVLHDAYNLCARSVMYRAERNCTVQCLPCRTLRRHHAERSGQVDAVVGVSRFVLERHLQRGYFAGSPIKTWIHNVKNITPRSRSGWRSGAGPVRFGYIGTLAAEKGIELLLQAFNEAACRDSELLIAGKGARGYEQSLARLPSRRVRFMGYRDPDEFFSSIDVLVVPSLCHDTFPGVALESLLHGVPVIGSRRGGIPEIIRDGENGVLFEPDAPGALRALLERFADSPEKIGELCLNIANGARPEHDFAGWLDKYMGVYAALRGFIP